MKPGKWIGVDFDGTLATHQSGESLQILGQPIAPMIRRVQRWLTQDIAVRVFTARVSKMYLDWEWQRDMIQAWCFIHIGQPLPVTAEKDGDMIELWDDRAVGVRRNSGEALSYSSYDHSCRVCAAGPGRIHTDGCVG